MSDPTSWFPARVEDIAGELLTVRYEDGSTAELWRHHGFDDRVAVAQRLPVCERWSLISVPHRGELERRLLTAQVRSATWRRNDLPPDRPQPFLGGIVDLETGEGLDLLHRTLSVRPVPAPRKRFALGRRLLGQGWRQLLG